MEEARRFYFSDGYTAAKLVREKASEADLILVEGVQQQTQTADKLRRNSIQ